MGIDVIIGIIGSVFTTVTGIGYFLDKNGRRIDDRFESIIVHMERMEKSINDMRADLPLKYTLREDHVRLSEKVDDLDKEFTVWRHTDSSWKS